MKSQHHPQKIERMRQRSKHLTVRELGSEFGMSKSHAHRLINSDSDDEIEANKVCDHED